MINEKIIKIDEDPNKLPSQYFSAIYLIFDFDPHVSNFNLCNLRDALEIFNNETENGKLFINYPMFEAIKHFTSLEDNSFINSSVLCTRDFMINYKTTVNNEAMYKNYNDYSYELLIKIIKMNYKKYSLICNKSDYKELIDCKLLLEKQLELYNEKNEVYILSSFILLFIDYDYNILN